MVIEKLGKVASPPLCVRWTSTVNKWVIRLVGKIFEVDTISTTMNSNGILVDTIHKEVLQSCSKLITEVK